MNPSGRVDATLERAEELLPTARIMAISSQESVSERFPDVNRIGLDEWQFFVTVAAIYVASLRIPMKRLDEIGPIVDRTLREWDRDAARALFDCRDFVERSVQNAPDESSEHLAAAIGLWVLWNGYAYKPSSAQAEAAGAIGTLLIHGFGGWWDADHTSGDQVRTGIRNGSSDIDPQTLSTVLNKRREKKGADSAETVASFLPVGVGFAIGLGAIPGWGFLVVLAAFVSAGTHIALRSINFRDYKRNLMQRGGGAMAWSSVTFFVLKFVTETVKIGLAAAVGLMVTTVA